MGFFRRLFGGGDATPKNTDPQGIYVYVRTKRAADAVVKLRLDKQYDLQSADYGYFCKKMIVDPKYFSRVEGMFYFDRSHNLTGAELDGGEVISAEAYDAIMNPPAEEGEESEGTAAE